MEFLQKIWKAIEEKAARTPAGELVHEDLPLPLRVLRDSSSPAIARVRVDSEPTYRRVKEFAEHFVPHLAPLVELYTEERPIFDVYGIDDEIDRALNRKVPLKSGGHVVFDQTEAMTTIDVNTGAYVGHRNLEETIFRTNLEAAVAIARQLRLRNLGGIIIIDFIDMTEEEHRRQVLQALTDRLAGDHAKSQVMSVSPLGPRRDDAQAESRELGTRAVPGLSKLRRPRIREDGRNRLPRDLPRDSASAPPVRFPGAAGARAPAT